jgi:hypothetical protein
MRVICEEGNTLRLIGVCFLYLDIHGYNCITPRDATPLIASMALPAVLHILTSSSDVTHPFLPGVIGTNVFHVKKIQQLV